ncbi:hypothetical protein [Reyranella sp.]|uniref:hypothetical protein n=1 Tax=Reyranella sp. TaxID=1929291 RepID=UPI003C7E5D0C
MAAIAFNRWTKKMLPVSNSIMAVDVLLGVYFAEHAAKQPTTFKELSWDLRCSEQAIRSIVERLRDNRWVVLEQDERYSRAISRLRIQADKVGLLEEGLRLLQAEVKAAQTSPIRDI